MRIRCGRGKGSWKDYWTNWHRVFAWFPIQVDDFDCRWLEYIERRYEWVGASGTPYNPEYRDVMPKGVSAGEILHSPPQR